MKLFSVKGRLYFFTFSITSLTWALVFATVIFGLKGLIISLTEDALEIRSEILASALPLSYFHESDPALTKWLEQVAQTPPNFVDAGFDSDSSYQIWYNGKVIIKSYISPMMPEPTQEGASSFFDQEQDDDIVWLTYATKIKGKNAWAVATEDMELAFEGIFPFTLVIFIFISENFPYIFVILPLSFIGLFFGIKKSIAPIIETSDKIEVKEDRDNSTIKFDKNPIEIKPLIDRINLCYEIIRQNENELNTSLESEKKFTANAAHELLTPLAAIKSEAQLRERQTNDPVQKEGLAAISLRVDRATHTVEQLVTLARLDPKTAQEKLKDVNLCHVIQNISAELGNKISEKDIDFRVSLPEQCNLRGLSSAIGVLCRNLIDNAVRYCSENGVISIEVFSDTSKLTLRIKNTGRPIPDYMRDYIFDRFVRGAGEEETGSGLGMSIVKRVAEIHRAEVLLSDPEDITGVQVDVVFPV
ncbi:HAMP domain-containing sensor histidine kinase [Kiloniella sp. EL199]|uniref:sensor histidine kinase n=1 Tax=Kiloniella sp. EL199 TaxID=2107581 RepID=UPI000EA32D0A|nr:ATP-binding protein [Kiloniella sp. EL199]